MSDHRPSDELRLGDFDLAAWAWRVRMSFVGLDEADLLSLNDLELGLHIARRSGLHLVETTSRSTVRRVVASFSSSENALRYVVMRLGASWRSGCGCPPMPSRTPADGTGVEAGPTAYHLAWTDGWAEFDGALAGRREAVEFSHVVGLSPAQIAARYEKGCSGRGES